MAKKAEVVFTAEELNMAREILIALGNAKTAYGVFAGLVSQYVGEFSTAQEADGRIKHMYAALRNQGADEGVMAAVRKAVQRMRADAGMWAKQTQKATRGTKSRKEEAKAAKPEQKVVKKIEHVLPDWAKDLPPLVAAWAEEHAVSATAALIAAYKRDTESLKKVA